MEPTDRAPIYTLRLSEKEKDKLIWAINSSPQVRFSDDGSCLRVATAHTEAVLSLGESVGQESDFSVIAYAIGRHDVSMIHGRYMHPGTRCRVRFQSLEGGWHERTGQTRYCNHVQGMIHVVLISFEEPVDLDEFAHLTAEQETQHLQELANELPMMGQDANDNKLCRVLAVDDQASDRKLLSFWLSRANMQVTSVSTMEAAMDQLAEDEYDLMVIDMQLQNESGVDLIKKVRAGRPTQTILAVSANDEQSLQDRALGAGAERFLCKPFEEQTVVSVVHELLGLDDTAEHLPIYSTLSEEPDMLPLLTGYVRSLQEKIHPLRETCANHNYEKLEMAASRLKGTGAGYGYPQITNTATELLDALHADVPDMNKIKYATNQLIHVLGRVKVCRPRDTDGYGGSFMDPKAHARG